VIFYWFPRFPVGKGACCFCRCPGVRRAAVPFDQRKEPRSGWLSDGADKHVDGAEWKEFWQRWAILHAAVSLPELRYRDRFGRETVTWIRTFQTRRPRRFDAYMIHSRQRGKIVDYLGTHQYLAVDLDLTVDERAACDCAPESSASMREPSPSAFPCSFPEAPTCASGTTRPSRSSALKSKSAIVSGARCSATGARSPWTGGRPARRRFLATSSRNERNVGHDKRWKKRSGKDNPCKQAF